MRKLIISVILFWIFTVRTFAAFQVDMGFNYFSDEDDVTTFSYSKLDYRGFFGASLDSKEKIVFGINFSQFGRDFQNSGVTGKYSVMEIGPKFQFYFTGEKATFLSLAWNPYALGSKTVASTETDISGSSYTASLGYQLKISRSFCIGASLNYHAISISKETNTTTNVETEVTNSYTAIYPMIELSLRFR